MPVRYQEIANRLRAFRMGSGLNADEVAKRVGISRTALYRLEKGELAKLETLEKLAELLSVSMPTLLGVGTEYLSSAVTYFERMRQIEETAEHIIVLAGPISLLLASDDFLVLLRKVLLESIPVALSDRDKMLSDIELILSILGQRKENYLRRRPGVLNILSAREVSRFLQTGMVGSSSLSEEELSHRRMLARTEVEHFARVIEEESIGVQIGVVTEALPHTGFQIFRLADTKVLALSPFRLGEFPNVRLGVAMVTSDDEAILLHEKTVNEMWRTSIKGPAAAAYLRSLVSSAAITVADPAAGQQKRAAALTTQ